MTKRHAVVDESLAARGVPLQWANEQEAARLSGMSFEAFRKWLMTPAAATFPPVEPRNGKRRIPGIVKFWGLGSCDDPANADPKSLMSRDVVHIRDRMLENFGTPDEAEFKRRWGFLSNDQAAIEYSRTGKDPSGRSRNKP